MSDAPLPLAARLEGPADAPVLVLGNSLGTTRTIWDPQLPALRQRFRLLRFDWPGHGGAPVPAPGPYSIAALGGGVRAVLDEHGIERAAYCGISLGGMVGMWLAARHPDRIAALGLVCTSAYMPPASAWHARAGQVRAAGMGSVSDQVLARWFTAEFRAREPGLPAAIGAEFGRCEPEGYAGCCEAIAAMDLRPDLAAVTAPTLIVAAAEDPATPPAHGAAIARGIAGARLVVIRGAAHLVNVSNPGEVTATLLRHLDGVTMH